MSKILDAIKSKVSKMKAPPVPREKAIQNDKLYTFSFEFDVIQYPNIVIGTKNIDVDADAEDEALNLAAEILNSELESDQHLRYTQKFTRKGKE